MKGELIYHKGEGKLGYVTDVFREGYGVILFNGKPVVIPFDFSFHCVNGALLNRQTLQVYPVISHDASVIRVLNKNGSEVVIKKENAEKYFVLITKDNFFKESKCLEKGQ